MRLACRAGLLALTLLSGCAELQQRPSAPPPGIASTGDPLRGGAEALVLAFADGGRGLTGRPADMALAVARLEYMTDALRTEQRLASVPEAVRFQMVAAVREARGALGMAEGAAPARAVSALLETRRALIANDRSAAEGALAPPLVTAAGLPPLGRLADMGGLPQAAIATALLRDEMTRLDAESGWRNGAITEVIGPGTISTFGMGGNTDR